MTASFEEGRVLQGRFVLRRSLLAGAVSQLWLAHDRELDAELLLRLHPGADRGVREAIARDANRHRRLHHPNVARICDVHSEDELTFVSIVPAGGELLSMALSRTGPMPYRAAIEGVRPLVDALAYLHENGGEHGRIDASHVIASDAAGWVLLPADTTQTAGSDMPRLGRLISALLTGGGAPDDERPLNDLPDRLHAGRTVPALLEQLVGDLRAGDAAQRPAGMRDVLRRLDQLDAVLAPPAPSAAPDVTTESPELAAARPAEAPPAPVAAGPRLVAVGAVVAAVVLIGAWVLLRPLRLDRGSAEPDAVPETARGPQSPPAGSPAEGADEEVAAPTAEEQAALAAARAGAEQALTALLVARQQADQVGAAQWAETEYAAAAARAAAADAAFLAERHAEAADGYRGAAESFEGIVQSADAVLERLLAEGAAALAVAEAERAAEAFRRAALIDPRRAEIEAGLQRASTIEELHRMLTRGLEHEADGRIEFAHAEYAAATALDPRSEEAATALARIKTRLADEQFGRMMARGLDAYHRGAYDEARARLLEARAFRPGAAEVGEALAMIDEARIRDRVDELRLVAEADERNERWQAAWNNYRRLLAIDAAIEFAQEGKARCEAAMRLEQHARHFLDNPGLLVKDGSREEATGFVDELAQLDARGPRLQRLYEELAAKVRLANTPLRIVIRSDDKTQVDVYRVGRYGSFESRELTLLPGVYTVVGHRKGYKDVRLELDLEPGAEGTVVTVICTESI